MANLDITNEDAGSVVFKAGEFRDDLLVFAAADTFVEGTLLARKAVADTPVAVAGVGDTGDGTCTVLSVVAGSIIPLVGAYNLECVAAVGNGGVWKLEDPNGTEVANDITMTPGAGGTTVIKVAGMQFTLTDGSADFIVGDSFAITVAADGKLYPYAIAGAGGVQIPLTVLTYEVTKAAGGNLAIRYMLDGTVQKDRLVIDADGDDSNITEAILDQLRSYGINTQDAQDLSVLDNQ